MFKKLSEVAEGRTDVFTIRGTNVRLIRKPRPTVVVEITGDPEVLTNSRERREHFATASHWLVDQMTKWSSSDFFREIPIATKDHPLEILCGNVILSLIIEGKKYCCSVYRDIFPKGWLFQGGCSHSISEIKRPKDVAFREIIEEILIADNSGNIYNMGDLGSVVLQEEFAENIESWQKESALSSKTKIVELNAEVLNPPVGHAENVEIIINGQKIFTEKVSVVIDSGLAILDVNLYLELTVPVKFSELRLFDCERLPNKTLLNRPVRLTNEAGNVVAIFSRGDNIIQATWINEAMKLAAVIIN